MGKEVASVSDRRAEADEALRGIGLQLQNTIKEVTSAAANADSSISEILVTHLFVERQLDQVLARRLVRPVEISRFGFVHKVALLRALHGHPRIDDAAKALLALNDIRNAAAHNDFRAMAAARIKLAAAVSGPLEADSDEVKPGERLERMVVLLLVLLEFAVYDDCSQNSKKLASQ